MTQRTRVGDRGSATEPEFYLPAGDITSFEGGRFERIWAALFDRRI